MTPAHGRTPRCLSPDTLLAEVRELRGHGDGVLQVIPDGGTARPLELVAVATTGTRVLVCDYRPT